MLLRAWHHPRTCTCPQLVSARFCILLSPSCLLHRTLTSQAGRPHTSPNPEP